MATRSILRELVMLVAAALTAAVALASAVPAFAQQQLRGVALVIGNSEYEHLPALANPQSDARAVEALLSDLGFETELSSDRDARRLARDLDTFAEDAEGADVAVLYYAGHGIEAGGENFLVPVDADLSALDAAGEKLVPIADHIRRLRETVAVTIVLLDACRDNPFPPGATLTLAPGAAPQPVAAAGLALPDTRGAAPLSRDGTKPPTDDSLGIVVGFAAEPGKPALDGKPGENSPYAAAVLKHLSAMAGSEFGQVMRMVGEEVYLRTGGAQRPWVNESLRRLLYFGEAPQEPAGAEGDILRERRQLLLTIADLPDLERAQVERVAARGGVPMDAVYGMLKALGQDVPDDPGKLAGMLDEQAEKLRKFLAERATLQSTDAEIVRLSALADRAVEEGAIETAIRLHEDAKARVAELERTVANAEADIRARRIEFAEVYAASAEAYELAFRHLEAVADYERAFRQVERWDIELASTYRSDQSRALGRYAAKREDASLMQTAVSHAREAVALASALPDRKHRGEIKENLAIVLFAHATLEAAPPPAWEEAVTVMRDAAADLSATATPRDRQKTQAVLAGTLAVAGHTGKVGAASSEAAPLFREAVQSLLILKEPLDWFRRVDLGGVDGDLLLEIWEQVLVSGLDDRSLERTYPKPLLMLELAAALTALGDRAEDEVRLAKAIENYRSALAELSPRDDAANWARANHGLGKAIARLAQLQDKAGGISESVEIWRSTLDALDEAAAPEEQAELSRFLIWGLMQTARGRSDTSQLEEAVVLSRAVLSDIERADDPLGWSRAHDDLGYALLFLGMQTGKIEILEESVASYRLALTELAPQRTPDRWADTQYFLGSALRSLGTAARRENDLTAALAAYDAALTVSPPAGSPDRWATIHREKGLARYALARISNDPEEANKSLHDAITAFSAARDQFTFEKSPDEWLSTYLYLGKSLSEIGKRSSSPKEIRTAITAFDAALSVITRNERPSLWTELQQARGSALFSLGNLENQSTILEQAAAAFLAADNALAHAYTLLVLGRREPGSQHLAGAQQAYERLLQQVSRTEKPLEWSLIQHRLGEVYQEQSNVFPARSGQLLMQAAAAFRAALEERPRQTAEWAEYQNDLGSAYLELGSRWSGGELYLGNAVDAFRASLGEEKADAPTRRIARIGLGRALWRLAELRNDASLMREAVEAFRQENESQKAGADTELLRNSYLQLGNALEALWRMSRDVRDLEAKVAALDAAARTYRQESVSDESAKAQCRYAEALAELARQSGDGKRLREWRDATEASLPALGAAETHEETSLRLCVVAASMALSRIE